ncbi:hypothetical protein BDV93DRAFT_564689 [Ceratobasidium sp. AG-I]|nr:hypothetical protein BDV93DRAFT_564689 [Ceratobasidium sp. AG-I]
MPTSNIVFDYPIRRPYPWRFTTSSVFLVSIVVLVGLVYFNWAIVGLTSTSYSSTAFIKAQDPSWIDRVNVKKALNIRGCEPTTLVSGGTYRTQNGLFPYTIESIVSAESREGGSTLAYEGSVIENCTIVEMDTTLDFGSSAGKIETTIKCALPWGVIFRATTETPIYFRVSSGQLNEPHNLMAQTTSRILDKLYVDVIDNLAPASSLDRNSTGSCGVYINWNAIEDTGYGVTCDSESHREDQAASVGITLFSYASALWSAVLLDLGVNASYNILTHPELMRQTLQPTLEALAKLSVTWDPRAFYAQAILADMTKFGLPVEEPQPVQFLAQYLCHGMTWKQPSNLIIDVLVATISLFMAYWTILNFVLRYLATRSSPHENYCVCPNCSELPQFMYKPVPTRSQSTPP